MIFVITGTEAFSFNRMIEEVDRLKKENLIVDDIHIQLGSCTYIPESCTWDKWLPFNTMCDNIIKSEIVIAHAGAGTTLLCLELGKHPIIVTRQKRYNEHLDDHQIPFAKMMEKLEYAHVAYDPVQIGGYIKKISMNDKRINKYKKDNSELIDYLNNWLNT